MADHAADAYEKLTDLCHELGLLRSTCALLGWDQEAKMPIKGLDYRAEQMAYLTGKSHRLWVDPHVGDWIAACEEGDNEEGSIEAANITEWRRNYDHAVKLPQEFVEEFSTATTMGRQAWQTARSANDFSLYAGKLEKIVDLNRQKADYYGWETCRYDALLDLYERGATEASLRELFTALEPEIRSILHDAAARANRLSPEVLKGDYPIEKQKAFNNEVVRAMGFDFEAGRIDTTAHPFCSGLAPGDTRLTTRYDVSDFTGSLFGVLHETGHGLYEQNLPADQFGLPVGNAVSLGIHESQSRLWENQVGRSLEFWEHWLPTAANYFPELASWTPEEMALAVNHSQLSHIRVDADESAYDLHILLRFDIESKIISGDLDVADLPAYWNESFEKLFGLRVTSDAEGCLQDIHWSMGAFGYFPTYTLGNLNASQLYSKTLDEMPEIAGQLARGDYSGLFQEMTTRIHQHGSRYLPADLMQRATGEPVNPKYHLEHLRSRYVG